MNTATLARNRFPIVFVVAIAAAVFVGFARTFYLKFLFDAPPLTRAALLHGLIATVWVALHYTQARLIAAHRVALHKQLGIFTACVGALLVIQVPTMAIANAAAGHGPPGRDPLQFLSVPLGTNIMFALFLGSALGLRKRREWHKRFMLLATLTLLMPAMGRLDTQIMQPLGLPRAWLALIVTVGFIAWACMNDWRKTGRVHQAYWIGGIVLLVSMPLRKWIGMTDAWRPIAGWLVSG